MTNELVIQEIIEEARTYLGVKWVHQGRSRKGVDCVGFLLLAFLKFKIKLNEIKGYARKPDGIKLKKILDEQENLRVLNRNEKLKPGDVVLFRIRHDPQHVAMLTESNTAELGMIHAFNGGQKRVVEHDFADYWRTKVVSVYRLNIK